MKKLLSVFLTLALILSTFGICMSFTASAEAVAPAEGIVEFDSADDLVYTDQSTHVSVTKDADAGVLSLAAGYGNWIYAVLPLKPVSGVTYSYAIKYRVSAVDVNTDNNCLQLCSANGSGAYGGTVLSLIGNWTNITEVTDYQTLTGTFTYSDVGLRNDLPYLCIKVFNGDSFCIDYVQITAHKSEGTVEFNGPADTVFITDSNYISLTKDTKYADAGVLSIAGGLGQWKSATLPIKPVAGVTYSYAIKYRVSGVDVNTDNNCLQLCSSNSYGVFGSTVLNLIPTWTNITEVTDYQTLTGTFTYDTVGLSTDLPYLAIKIFNGDSFYIDSITIKADYWDGTSALSYAGGTGTVSDPYLISTPAQLRKMVTTTEAAKYYCLTNDIYVNDTTNYANWGTEAPAKNWWTWELNQTEFTGIVDGNGYTVYGLYSATDNLGGNKFAGLIARIGNGSKITNLHIRKSYIYGEYAAAFVGTIGATGGSNATLTVSGCSVDDTVTITGSYGGGLIGLPHATVTVENCYSAAKLTAATYNGGIYGNVWSGWAVLTIKNFYSDGWFPLGCDSNFNIRFPGTAGTYTNVYYINLDKEITDAAGIEWIQTSCADMDLDETYWYGTDVKYLKNRGIRNYDVNEDDSDTPDSGDLVAMKKILLFGTTSVMADCNADSSVDVLDFICLKKKISFFA